MKATAKFRFSNWENNMPNSLRVLRIVVPLFLFFITALAQPILALSVTGAQTSSTNIPSSGNLKELSDRAQKFYQSGQFDQAIQLWQQVSQSHEKQGNLLELSLTLSNLSLAHQKLGQWQPATTTISKSLEIARTLSSNPKSQGAIAQALDIQGNLQLAMGKAEQAIITWQQASAIYEQLGDRPNQLRNSLKQSQALKIQGFYRRARQSLEAIQSTLSDVNDPLLKAIALHNYGDILIAVGELKLARKPLEQSLALLETNTPKQIGDELSSLYLSLGNLSRLEANVKTAKSFYKKSLQIEEKASGRSLLSLQANLNLFSLLIESSEFFESDEILTALEMRSQVIDPILANLTPSRDVIFARINYGKNLLKVTKSVSADKATLLIRESANNLAEAVKQAKEINNDHALAYALGSLGNVYEQSNQLEEAQKLTQQALAIAQSINSPDIAYRWQWQLGRILKAKRDIRGAVFAYTEAVNGLRQIRSDLAFVNPNVQFSFRESVEPVYRELVSLLLQDDPSSDKQTNLLKAQSMIESLQLAELVNFFRSDCLTAAQVDINQVDRSAAVIYPILLEDRLEVIISLPDQPLHHYASPVTATEVDSLVDELRGSLINVTSDDYLASSQKLYDWLIRPAESAIVDSKIKTLVFVLDGSLRNVPMAVLHDGKQHLVETYSLALTPGLQLLDPQPIVKQRVTALIAGLTEARQGFSSLPSVKDEVQQISKQIPSSSVFIDNSFTKSNIASMLTSFPFPIIHLATHGNFSSEAEDTYLLTYDGKMTIDNLNQLLRSNNLSSTQPVEILILSACQTALGDKRAALGLAGMAIRAGARSTIASLWSVNDEATSQFMIALYQSLASGNVTRAESLRLAQQSLIKDKDHSHPYYWAPFILLGNWL
ncbi:MAG: CHAT domain-containing protein [Pseudanabaena sp.]|jgi:CHAT domain-containing protein